MPILQSKTGPLMLHGGLAVVRMDQGAAASFSMMVAGLQVMGSRSAISNL
jgi:hypothetical protein